MTQVLRRWLFSVPLFISSTLVCADLIGINLGGPVFRIDQVTGRFTYSASNVQGGNALAQNGRGYLYTAAGYPGGIRTIERIELNSSSSSIVCNLTSSDSRLRTDQIDVRGMAFNAQDELFLVLNGPSDNPAEFVTDLLVKTDIDNCAVQVLGPVSEFSGVQGLDFAPDGRLYGWDVNFGLLQIDTESGAAVDIDGLRLVDAGIQTIFFDADGKLFGAGDDLFLIDPISGLVTLIGNGNEPGADVRGLAQWPGRSISIDIKPWRKPEAPNTVNLNNRRQRVWVAILSDNGFDALQVQLRSVRFGSARPLFLWVVDVNSDGLTDLLFQFKVAHTGIVCGDASASLTGETYSGEEFSGVDEIKTAGCK